jgi:N-sulfoglucosamine sulfohydrolase
MAFTSTASCSASRSVIYTGLHTHETGQYGLHHDYHHFMTFADVPTAPALLNAAGYHTGIIGKVHVGPEAVYPWQHREESGTRDVDWVAARARAYFAARRGDGQPFFLTVGFIDPHRDETRGGFGNDTFGADGSGLRARTSRAALPDRSARGARWNWRPTTARSTGWTGVWVACWMRSTAAGWRGHAGHVPVRQRRAVPQFQDDALRCGRASAADHVSARAAGGRGQSQPRLLHRHSAHLPRSCRAPSPRRAAARAVALPILEATDRLPGWDVVFGSHTFHEITNYWPTRFLRTPRYKYHRNVAWQLDFPFSGDLYGSLSWQGIRRRRSGDDRAAAARRLCAPPARRALRSRHRSRSRSRNLAQDPEHAERLAGFRAQMEAWQRDTRDPWLYRDGVSVMAVEHHLPHGLTLPERFDFDPDTPSDQEA